LSTVVAKGGASTNSHSCVSDGVVVQGVVNCARPAAPSGAHSLRLSVTPKDPGFFKVAFAHDPGLPPETATYLDLIRGGGVDVNESTSRVTLGNRSDKPLSITDVHIEVVGVKRPPRAAYAYMFTQGDAHIGAFEVPLHQQKAGATANLYKVVQGMHGPDPFFSHHYVSLAPGEIYEADVTVTTLYMPEQLVDYRFVVSGSTADKPFTIASKTIGHVSGLGHGEANDHVKYRRAYVLGLLLYEKQAEHCPGITLRNWSVEPAGLVGACP
jgi:hypothetical protein